MATVSTDELFQDLSSRTTDSKEYEERTSIKVRQFLNYVVTGRQDEAEAMLKENSELALATGTAVDYGVDYHAKRTFKGITGFQYAVWALDWHMWKMIREYLSKEAAAEQAKGFAEGAWVAEHGEHVNWKKLMEAQQTLIDNWSEWRTWHWEKLNKYWVQDLVAAQLLLPMHVLQEYDQPDRPFEPCPKFDTDYTLIRSSRHLANCLSFFRLGNMVLVRGALVSGAVTHTPQTISGFEFSEQAQYSSHYGIYRPLPLVPDLHALDKLASTRIQQRAQLVAELSAKSHSSSTKSQSRDEVQNLDERLGITVAQFSSSSSESSSSDQRSTQGPLLMFSSSSSVSSSSSALPPSVKQKEGRCSIS